MGMTTMIGRWLMALLLLALLAGCASSPGLRDAPDLDLELLPDAAIDAEPGARVVWGGRVLDNQPTADGTVLQVLGYPLDRFERPNTDRPALGRFLAQSSDFLEPEDYRSGRLITVRGELTEQRPTRIGELERALPLIETDTAHLWPIRREPAGPRLFFGIGVSVSR